MSTTRYLALATIAAAAAAASSGAWAARDIASGELGNQSIAYMPHHASSADRSQVEATAAQGNRIEGEEGAITAHAYRMPSGTADRSAVHASAVQAEQQGDIAHGAS